MGADSALKDAVYDRCEKDVGMGLCQYVDFCVYASSLPCLHTFGYPYFIIFFFFKCSLCRFFENTYLYANTQVTKSFLKENKCM